MPWCALLTAVKNYNKSLEKLQEFQDRDRDQDQDQKFKTKTKTKTSWSKTKTKIFTFVLEAPWDQDPGLEDYVTALLTKLLPSLTRLCICLCLSVCLNEFLWFLEGWDVWVEPAD